MDLRSREPNEGRAFFHFELLDAKIAFSLKKMIFNPHFRRRVSVEEQHAQKHDRFLRGRQIAFMIHDHFPATGACDAAQGLSHLFNIHLREDDIQDFDTRWDQVLSTACEILTENVLEGLYKLKIRDSVQLPTALAMYDKEIVRNLAMPSCQRLKILVRRLINQMTRTRNFKPGMEGLRQEYWSRAGRGEKSALRGKWETAISGKQLVNVQEETLVVSAPNSNRGQKAQSSSPAPKSADTD